MAEFDALSDFKEAQQTLANFLAVDGLEAKINKAIALMVNAIAHGGKVIAAGNGGSMCDAMHFAEELTGRFRNDRYPYAAVAISDPSHLTCVGNDYGFDYVFSRFIQGMAYPGDVFLGISTSGNSENIYQAWKSSRCRAVHTVLLLGKDGGKLKDLGDVNIIVPHQGYADRIQEVHTMIIHTLIRGIELKMEQNRGED